MEDVDSAAAGDGQDIDALLVRHLEALHAFVRLRAGESLRGRESSSDLVQSACRELLADPGSYRFQGEVAFKNWLFTVAANKVIDRLRFHHRAQRDVRREVGAETGADDVPRLLAAYATLGTPSGELMSREAVAQIEASFAQLPPEQREVIALSRIGGLTYREIAAETGRTEVAVRGLVVRGLAKLAELLDRAG